MKKQLLLLTLLMSLTTLIFAQKHITGKITDEKGEPLVGASIVIEGTNQGVLNDIDGNYTLPMPKNAKEIVVSFVGYEKRVIEIKDQLNVNIQLVPDVKYLDEFIVIGYGVIRRTSCGGCGTTNGYSCCGCGGYSYTQTIASNNSLEAHSLENGATKLSYNLNSTLSVAYQNGRVKHDIWDFAKNKVYYTISKSTDGLSYKKIGTSESDTKPFTQVKGDSTLNTWGGSQFLDKEPNETDSVYYLIEGFTQPENSSERQNVYSKKITVAPTEGLKINSLYANARSNQLEIGLSSPKNEKADFVIADMSGRILLKEQRLLFKENNTLVLTNGNLIAGVYVLSVHQNGRLLHRKFVVAD